MNEQPDVTEISGPTASLPREPKPSVDRVEELAMRILQGDILLPKFQRSFVWERPQIRELLDSIARNYPIGSVLLWQSKEELRSERRIADLDVDLPRAEYPVNYLLDGQQRLSAICGALYWKGTNPTSRWNLVYDLRRQAFEHLNSLEDPPLHKIRLNKLSDASSFFKHVASFDTLDAQDKEELGARADELFNRFKDYKIATVTLGDMPIADVAPIFERINSTGTPLTIVDLMRAATWSPDFDLLDSIDDIREDLAEKGFAATDRKVILRNLSAAAGKGFSADNIDQLRHNDSEQLKQAVEVTREAYKRAIDFLVTEIGVPGFEVIPYANQLTVLTELFRQVKQPSAAQFAEIKTWFWRTSLSGYFSGWNTGMMASDLGAVASFAAGRQQGIHVDANPPGPHIWIERQFRANNAHAKLLALVLAHNGPVDLLTGNKVDVTRALSWGNNKEFHHFFPQAFLKAKQEDRSRINCLANFVMLTSVSNKAISDRPPSQYLPEVENAAGAQLADWLAANLIPMDAFEAAKEDDFDGFLKARSRCIHDRVMSYTDWNRASS